MTISIACHVLMIRSTTADRIVYAGTLYHVMATRDRPEAAFKDEEARESCPQTWLGILCYRWAIANARKRNDSPILA
jgi:hypothetical protein